jgi:hypothetical protein
VELWLAVAQRRPRRWSRRAPQRRAAELATESSARAELATESSARTELATGAEGAQQHPVSASEERRKEWRNSCSGRLQAGASAPNLGTIGFERPAADLGTGSSSGRRSTQWRMAPATSSRIEWQTSVVAATANASRRESTHFCIVSLLECKIPRLFCAVEDGFRMNSLVQESFMYGFCFCLVLDSA